MRSIDISVDGRIGPRFECFSGDAVGNALAEGRFWDAHLKPLMESAAGAGWALDVGAYIGFHTWYLAALYDRVLAVEPQPKTYAVLRKNVGHLENVTTIQGALYDAALYLMNAPDSDTGWDTRHESNAPSVPLIQTTNMAAIPAVPGDRLVPPDADVRFIKIDVQGCDLRVLVGLQQTIRRCRPLIVFEWEADYAAWHGDTWDDVLAWATQERYHVARITDDYWDYVARPQ